MLDLDQLLRPFIQANARKRYCILVVSPDAGATTRFTSARNPNRTMLRMIDRRGWSDEIYVIRTADMEVVTFYPPLIPQ